MITKIQTPSAISAYRQFPQEGTGTQTDPFDWYTVDTVVEAVSTVTVVEAGNYDSIEKYYNIKLTASQLYTFSISGVDEYSTTVTIYLNGTQVAQSTSDPWALAYTPTETGTYLIKISTYSYGSAGTLSTTPVPGEITPWIEKTNGVLESTGFDTNYHPDRFARLSAVGLLTFWHNAVFSLKASNGFVDLSSDPVILTNNGNIQITNGYFVFDTYPQDITTTSKAKLNLGTGNWTIDVVVISDKQTSYPCAVSTGQASAEVGYPTALYVHHDSFNSGNTSVFGWNPSSGAISIETAFAIASTERSLRLVRDGNFVYGYVDGVLISTTAVSATADLNFDQAVGLRIGRDGWNGSSSQFHGQIKSIYILNIAHHP